MKSGGRHGRLVHVNRHSAEPFVHALGQTGSVFVMIHDLFLPHGDKGIPVPGPKIPLLSFKKALILVKLCFCERLTFTIPGPVGAKSVEQLLRSLQNRLFPALEMPGLDQPVQALVQVIGKVYLKGFGHVDLKMKNPLSLSTIPNIPGRNRI